MGDIVTNIISKFFFFWMAKLDKYINKKGPRPRVYKGYTEGSTGKTKKKDIENIYLPLHQEPKEYTKGSLQWSNPPHKLSLPNWIASY